MKTKQIIEHHHYNHEQEEYEGAPWMLLWLVIIMVTTMIVVAFKIEIETFFECIVSPFFKSVCNKIKFWKGK
jgi:hypothetical protein